MHDRTKELIEIMGDYSLSAPDVARILGRTPATVRIWRCRNSTRIIPAHALELLRAHLELETMRADAAMARRAA